MVYEKIASYTASIAVLAVVLAGCQAGSPDADSFHLVPERDRAAAAAAAEQENNPENLAFADRLEQAKALVPAIPNIPMLVLAATMGMGDLPPTWPAKEILAARNKQLRDLTAAVPRGELRYVDTGHFIQQLQPQLVIDEIQRMSGLLRRTVPS
jgi:hypothetical protein